MTRPPARRSRGSSGTQGDVLAVGYGPDEARRDRRRRRHRRLWNATTGDPVRVFHAHRGGVFATRFSADGTRLATLGADRAVRVWDVRTGRRAPDVRGVHDRTDRTSSGAKGWRSSAATASRSRRGSGESPLPSWRGVRRLVRSPDRRGRGSGGTARVVDLDVSPDGTMLVAGQAESGQLQLYELPSGGCSTSCAPTERRSSTSSSAATGGTSPPAASTESRGPGTWRAEYSARPDARGHRSRSGASRSTAQEPASPRSGRPRAEARRGSGTSPRRPRRSPDAARPETDEHADIAFTPDGRRLVAASGREGTVRVWSTATGKASRPRSRRANERSGPRRDRGRRQPGRLAHCHGEHGRQRAHLRCRDGQAAGHPRTPAFGVACRVNRAVFSPDGSMIATTGKDATVRIFDASTGRQLRVLRGHSPGGFGTYPVAWSPDGARLPLDGGRRNPHLGRAHRPKAARAAALRRPRRLRRLGPDGGQCSSSRVSAQTSGRVDRQGASHAGDERCVVRHGVQPRRVAARNTTVDERGLRSGSGTGPRASRP